MIRRRATFPPMQMEWIFNNDLTAPILLNEYKSSGKEVLPLEFMIELKKRVRGYGR